SRALLDVPAIGDKNAPIENAGPERAKLFPVRIDLGRPLLRKLPFPRAIGALDFVDKDERAIARAHRSIQPSATMTAPPPIDAATSLPASICMPSAIRLGRPMAKPCSMMI